MCSCSREGETDAILLSYYLGKVAGWKFCKKPPANIAIKADASPQSANWYENGDDRLLICAVGGKSNVGSFFKEKILRPVVDACAFSCIALVLDRDESEIKSIEDHASSVFKPVISTMRNNEWVVSIARRIKTILLYRIHIQKGLCQSTSTLDVFGLKK